MRGFAIHNAPTNHGGRILATQIRNSQMGNSFVRAGDGHFCPRCKCWSSVIKSHDHIIFDGKPVAYVGDKLTCGAIIQPQQSHVVGGSNANYHIVSNPQTEQTLPISAQQNLINSFTNKRKYGNYYIEFNKTDYVKFKTGIPPYDEDKKGLFGSVLQIVSGACDFIVTSILKKKNLFITVSYHPPVVKHDANKITPYATLRLYKEKNRKSELLKIQELKSDGGVWSIERGKEPVGFCNITLPEPDLLLLRVELDLGYVLTFSGGVVTPIPSFTTHSFTLNSAAREVR